MSVSVGRVRARAGIVALAGGAIAVVVSCRSPTQIIVEVRTDADCASVISTSVTTATIGEDLETKLPQAVRQGCTGLGNIGSIVLVPRDAQDAEIKLRVVAGLGRSADACTPPLYTGCVVVRRQLRFEPSETVRVTLNMPAGCRDRPCGPNATCDAAFVCVPITCANPPCATPADGGAIDAPRCEDVCPPPGTCNSGRCVFTCDRGSACRGTRCPDGVPCSFLCTAADACDDIRCGGASDCLVRCEADQACKNGLRCERARTCNVTCRSAFGFACVTDIRCPTDPSGSCNVACNGSCTGDVECCSVNPTLCQADEPARIAFETSNCQ